ncbi:NUDIX hydrolase [uncultured Rikenella sp.]|uniref:NUDIX hydrolase n=1 Tax=uncultured Rikenella sp. TaxID=368003 RepID=UPI002614988B|nr:NUDIX hydrolase [uncultured Rikenella sp.]
MKKVYRSDNVVAFGTPEECAALAAATEASWLVMQADTLGPDGGATLGLTNLQRIFETAKSVAFVSRTEEENERFFAQFAAQFLPIEAAGGLVVSPRGEVLMIFRNGRWDLPKGKLEGGEELAECAVREVEEECGIRGLAVGKLLTRTYHLYESHYEANDRWVLKRTTWFAMENDGNEELRPQTEEGITDIRWIAADSLASYIENTYSTIRDVFAAAKRF